MGSMVRDPAGNLYGTTVDGGTPEGGSCTWGCGTVFRVDAAGKETELYGFTGGVDGGEPSGALARDSSGNLYGTTQWGGAYGYGTVFEVDAAGKESVLLSFAGASDGLYPQGGVILDSAGNLYGTTVGGYAGGVDNNGTVFKIDTTGKEAVLYSFCRQSKCADGARPWGGVIRDYAGNLYGTTEGGGTYGWGTVFKLDTTGKETVLYSFTGKADGDMPMAGVVRDRGGNLYGTTLRGGSYSGYCAFYGCGVVFKIDAKGNEEVLYTFSQGVDPQTPNYTAGVILDKKGDIYGTFPFGGTTRRCKSECGLVFKITP